jgi:hypothetical protein
LTKQVVAKDVLAWDVLGQDAHVDLIYLQVVRPRERLAKLCAKFQGRPLDETVVMPARLEGPAFPHVLVGRGTWFVPPEDVYPYVAMAGIDRRFKLRPIAVVRRGSKSRVVRGNDIRPLLAKLQAAA